MKQRIYLGIDVGTQSARVLAVTETGEIAAAASAPLESTRQGARHEQEPEEWWSAVSLCCRQVMSTLESAGVGAEIAGLAVDATSGTVLLVDEQLRSVTPGLMYDDGRAHEEADAINTAGEQLWRELGYRMQPSWALPKLLWLARTQTLPKAVYVAHQNDFVNARFAGVRLAGDSSNSLKTGYDVVRLRWPVEIFDQLGLDAGWFPEVVLPGERIGQVCAQASEACGVPAGTPIFAGMTDGCGAQLASGATAVGSWNSVIGTTLVIKGATVERLRDPLGVIYSHRSADGLWLPGGASSTGGGAIAKGFAAEDLDRLNAQAMLEEPTSLVIYPLTGEGERYPFSAPEARGFTLGEVVSEQQRYQGTLQGIAFIERLAFASLRELGAPTDGPFTISGGASRSEALNQIRADVLERELALPRSVESAFGMAVLAGAHASSIAEATERMVHIERTIAPRRRFDAYAAQYAALVREFSARGWLSQAQADAALGDVA